MTYENKVTPVCLSVYWTPLLFRRVLVLEPAPIGFSNPSWLLVFKLLEFLQSYPPTLEHSLLGQPFGYKSDKKAPFFKTPALPVQAPSPCAGVLKKISYDVYIMIMILWNECLNSCKCTCHVCATKREWRCAGTCPYSDFDCGAFSTWTGYDELVLDPEPLATNWWETFLRDRYEFTHSVSFINYSIHNYMRMNKLCSLRSCT
jgi:hypothetical protein